MKAPGTDLGDSSGTATPCSGRKPGGAPDPTGVTLTIEPSGFAHLTFDLPGEKVNKLTTPVMERLAEHIETLAGLGREGRLHGLMICSLKPGTFVAGADLAEIEAIGDPAEGAVKARRGQRIFDALEALPFPVVCAVAGACVGGGYELALACTRIVASDDARVQVGLPEVRLGIVPGFGGTQRLPRRAGLRTSLDLILAGRTLDARRALKAGLVDLVVPAPLLEKEACRELIRLATAAGQKGALSVSGNGTRPRSRSWLLEGNPVGRAVLASGARRTLAGRARAEHYPASWKALEAVLAGYRKSREEAFATEARLLGETIVTRTSKNLVFLFNAQNAARKDPLRRLDPGGTPDGAARAVEKIGVVGAGVMGAGIARVAAEADLLVRLRDVEWDAVSRGVASVARSWARRVGRGRMDRRAMERRIARILPTTDWRGFATCDLVVEAVVERMDVKRRVLEEAEAVIPPGCVFATNTSSLRVTDLARAARRPERVCGLHFFNPVARMPLVEVIAGEATSRATLAAAAGFVVRIGKVPVVVRDGAGFLVNRLLMPYLGQAVALAEAGAPIEAIDLAATRWGLPMGPFRLLDEIGLDIAAHASVELARAFPARTPPSNGSLGRLAGAGLLGVKSGCGFYPHPGRDAGDEPDPPRRSPWLRWWPRRAATRPAAPEALRIVRAGGTPGGGAGGDGMGAGGVGASRAGAARGFPGGAALPAEADLVDLLVLPVINEAAACLDEGVVGSAEECDLAMVMGTGFPPFRGGPLRYADEIGAAEVVTRLEALAGRFGPHLRPVAPLVERARARRPFHPA